MRFRAIPLAVLCFTLVLLVTGCTTSTSTPDSAPERAPQRVCSVQGFGCTMNAAPQGTIALTLRNKLGTGLDDVSVTLASSDCQSPPKPVSLGRVPSDVASEVRFTCAGAPSSTRGAITVSYKLSNEASRRTAEGTFLVRLAE